MQARFKGLLLIVALLFVRKAHGYSGRRLKQAVCNLKVASFRLYCRLYGMGSSDSVIYESDEGPHFLLNALVYTLYRE